MKIKKAIFPVGGLGTRFLPATKSMPKEMMPIVNKPLIEYGVDEAIAAGIEGMCIVTGRGKHSLMDHFDMNYELEHQIKGTSKENMLVDIRNIIDTAKFTFIRQSEIYDAAEIQNQYVHRLDSDSHEVSLIIEGITCAACIWLNEQTIAALPGVEQVRVNYATQRALVRWDEKRIRLRNAGDIEGAHWAQVY